MTKVVVVSQLPPPTHGSTVMTQTLLETLDGMGDEWKLVDRRFSSSVGDIGKFKFRKVLSAAWMPMRLLASIVSFRPGAVILFATNRIFSFIVDWVLSEILRACNLRRILYLHTVGFRALASRGRVWELMVRRLLTSSHAVVCLGPTLARDIDPWVDPSRVVYIPNTVRHVPAFDGLRGNRPTILYFSNLIPQKGAEAFVNMAIELAPQLPGFRFVVAGATTEPDFLASLQRKTADAHLETRIVFPGAVRDAEHKWSLLRDSALLVFPSLYPYEAQPLTIVEALAAGTPVVAYDVGAVRDMLTPECGRLVPASDEDELKNATLAIARDPSLQMALSEGAIRNYEDQFSVRAFTEAWADTLTESLASGSRLSL